MEQIQLKNAKGATKERKRLGRGQSSGLGTTSGKGNKGQQSRKGYSRKVDFEGGQMPLFRRIPKRGFNNGLFKKVYQEVDAEALNMFDNNSIVTNLDLFEKNLIKDSEKPFKILGNGEIKKNLSIQLRTVKNGKKRVSFDKITKSSKDMVEKSGGKVVLS